MLLLFIILAGGIVLGVMVTKKKNKLNKQERVMTLGQLKEFCRSKIPLSIISGA